MGEALSPDFSPRDLPVMVEVLHLTDAQQPIIEQLVNDYTTAFDSGREEMLAKQRALRPERGGNDDEQNNELRETSRALMREMREAAAKAETPEERQRIMDEYGERLAEIREQLPEMQTEGYLEMLAEMDRLAVEWEAAKQLLREQFVSDVLAVLDEGQRDRWPILERRFRRDKSMGRGRLSGEALNLVRIVGTLDLEKPVMEEVNPHLEAYALRLDDALKARNAAMGDAEDELQDALRENDMDRAMQTAKRISDLRKAVRDVNIEFMRSIAEVLPESAAQEFLHTAREEGFPRIYRDTPAERMLAAAVEMPDLDDEMRMQVVALSIRYEAALNAHNDSIFAAVITHEPKQDAERFTRGRGGPQIERPNGPGPNEASEPAAGNDPIRAAFDARNALDADTINQLRALLGEERFVALPGGGRWADGPRGEREPGRGGQGRRGGGGAGITDQQWVMDQFDTDGDGELNEEERAALREYLQQRREGRRGMGGDRPRNRTPRNDEP